MFERPTGCSSTRNGPPARRHPTVAIHVVGRAVGGSKSLAPGGLSHPEKCGPELRGSMQAGARRCFRKLRSTYTMLVRICRGEVNARA